MLQTLDCWTQPLSKGSLAFHSNPLLTYLLTHYSIGTSNAPHFVLDLLPLLSSRSLSHSLTRAMNLSDHDHSYHMDTRDPFSVDTNANTDTETVPTHSATHTHTTGGHSSHRGMTRTLDQDEAGDFGCPQADDIVFSSLDTHFSFYVFVEQLIFHVFFPLTVPIAWYRFGMKHSHIQRYHYRDPAAYFFTYIPLLCVVAALCCLYAEPDVLRVEQLRLPFGVMLLQRMMISVKYASLSPDEYE